MNAKRCLCVYPVVRRKVLPWRIVNPRCPQHGRGGDWGRVEAA